MLPVLPALRFGAPFAFEIGGKSMCCCKMLQCSLHTGGLVLPVDKTSQYSPTDSFFYWKLWCLSLMWGVRGWGEVQLCLLSFLPSSCSSLSFPHPTIPMVCVSDPDMCLQNKILLLPKHEWSHLLIPAS